MTKLSESQKEGLVTWNAVVDALMSRLERHRKHLMAALYDSNTSLGDVHLKGMHRAVKTLAVFTDPSDD